MLDFGSRISNPQKRDDEEDLFSAAAKQNDSADDDADDDAADDLISGTATDMTSDSEPAAPVTKAAPPQPQPKREYSFRKRKSSTQIDEAKSEAGLLLQEARQHAGLSIAEVEKRTQIRAKYLHALETCDLDELPQPVYVLAYLRKLSSLYQLPPDVEAEIIQPWRQIPRELPENLPATIIRDENSENSKILHRLEIVLLSLGAIIVIGVVVFLVILAVSYFNGGSREQLQFDTRTLLELQDKPALTAPAQPPAASQR